MTLNPKTLAAAFVLLSVVLGVLLLFAWTHNRKIQALAWWGSTFCLIPTGIGMANLGNGVPSHLNLLVANALVTLGYGALYAGCRSFSGRTSTIPYTAIGPIVWIVVFPFIHETLGARLVVLSLISGGYAVLAGWELSRRAPQQFTSQRAAVFLLHLLGAFNLFRAMLGLSLGSLFGINTLASSWSAELALFLVVYAPALAFIFLAMAKERTELDQKCTEQALRESEDHYRYSVELNPQIPWTADPQGNIISASSRWFGLTGMPVEQGLGRGWIAALHPDDLPPTQQRWSRSVTSGDLFDSEYRLRLADGFYRWFRARATARRSEGGAIVRWYGTLEDIHESKLATHALRERERQLRWAAYHDDLTGLPNRRLFQERLQEALDKAAVDQGKVGLLVLDLDNLKTINDRFGHDAGDALLQELATRLCDVVRATDVVARLGGDEFAIILTDAPDEDYVTRKAGAILATMQQPLEYRGRSLDCRTSIGGSISARSDTAADELRKRADLALYDCKNGGRGTFQMFRPAMREEAQKTASALEVARRAIKSDWVLPFYQPKINLGSGRLDGFEALLRWHHPRAGVQSPGTIAPAFEDTELGRAIGARMLSSVLGDIRAWLEAGLEPGRVAINASSAEFRYDDYAERVLEELARAGLPTSCLEVEVTESVFLGRSARYIERALRTLTAAGVTVALDDFGTGYASLTHLKQFPVDVIKLDRSFIKDMETGAGDAAIVKAVLNLGQSLGIKVVAEGIETAQQASLLREQGCVSGQGYYFGHPMGAADIPHFIKSLIV